MTAQRRPAPSKNAREETLGDLRFEEWFDQPVFEPDRLERWEERATTGRGPVRLVATVWLKIDARASQLRHRPSPPPPRRSTPRRRTATPPPAPGMRSRIAGALDRWAEREAAAQVRLERLMLPRRWQT